MFTDQLNENWDSTENQDAFIKEYFGKVEVQSKSGQNLGLKKGKSKKIHSVQKSKSRSYEENNVCNSTQKKRMHSISCESGLSKKLKKFLSSFEEDSCEISENGTVDEMAQSCIVDQNVSKKKKSKNKMNREKDFLLLSNKEEKNNMKFGSDIESFNKISNNTVTNLNNVETEHSYTPDFKSQNSKRKRRLKNKNRSENHLEDSLLNSKGDELEKSATELDSKIGRHHPADTICNNLTASMNRVVKEQSQATDSSNQKSKKKRSKNKNIHKEDSSNKEKSEGNNEMELDSKVGRHHPADTIRNNLTANMNRVVKEQSQAADLSNQKSKRKRSKNKNIHNDQDSLNKEKLEENNEMEVDSEAEQAHVVSGKSRFLSANKSSAFQNKIHQKFQAAKFRYLNEMLYKSPGQEALSYFQENTDEFEDYHIGYQSQVSKWPVNPVDIIIQEIRQMNKEAVIADLGCGEAKIAEVFPKRTVHSFDLIAIKDCVTACDMANVPLPNNSVDIAVFCLSLMGTNWKDYIMESRRILKLGAMLKIAEIESRIENVNCFIKNIESFGFSLENQDLSHKMFIFLNFKKKSKSKKKSKVPDVTLKPCLYKKR